MIELLLQAERALSAGLADQAERMYRQAVAADPRNSIAVVGLARVALERADDAEAYRLAQRALGIDPENVAARRLADRLEEVYAHRGLPAPGTAAIAEPGSEVAGERSPVVEPVRVAEAVSMPASMPGPVPRAADADAPRSAGLPSVWPPMPSPAATLVRRSVLDRLLRRNRP